MNKAILKRSVVTLTMFAILALFALVGIQTASAHQVWDMTGSYEITFTCTSGCSGDYPHSMTIDTVDLGAGSFSGIGHYVPGGTPTWTVSGTIDDDANLDMDIDYDSSAYHLDLSGVIASNGSLSGAATSLSAQTFTWVSTSGSATHVNHGEITSPGEDEIVIGTVDLAAWYHDESPDLDDDAVSWAVRKGTCDAGVGTVFGNVDGYSDLYDWDGANFSSEWDASSATPGMYCLIVNPTDDVGQNNVRLTREFWVADSYIHGGGHILEDTGGKRKTWKDVSFGGWLADVGTLMGNWTVQFHNVGDDEYDKATFHATEFTVLNMYYGDSDSCDDAFNFTATGTLNGEEGYKVIVRGGDLDEPASQNPDTLRVSLYEGNDLKYDTHVADFDDESTCVGTARTKIDAGNLVIEQ